jgi:hypothetical protein
MMPPFLVHVHLQIVEWIKLIFLNLIPYRSNSIVETISNPKYMGTHIKEKNLKN